MIYHTLDLTLPELMLLRELVRHAIIDTECAERSRTLDDLYNNLRKLNARN